MQPCGEDPHGESTLQGDLPRQVQGVGFRYTTASIARRHPVQGYVRNQPDGTVELVAEGSPGPVRQFLDEVAAAFDGNITDQTTEEIAAGEPLSGFEIRH